MNVAYQDATWFVAMSPVTGYLVKFKKAKQKKSFLRTKNKMSVKA